MATRTKIRRAAVVSLWVLASQPGCKSDAEEEVPQPDVRYYGDVELIVQEHCRGCHEVGGVAPYPLDTYEAVADFGAVAINAMENGRMPPWAPASDCNSFADARVVPAEDIERFRRWVDDDTPAGDAADENPYVAPDVQLDFTHTARVPGGYVPSTQAADDYRCFVLDELELTEDRYLTGSQVVPGSPQVHHVLVYAIDPSLAAEVAEADEAEAGPGYSCFGGPVEFGEDASSGFSTGFPNQIAAWVPGQSAQELPEGMATRIQAGSPVVMQVHYSALAGEPQEDATELNLRLTAEAPAQLLTSRPLAVLDLDIPAGEANVEMTRRYTNYSDEPIVVRQLAGHMHLLGTQLRAALVPAAGEQSCLIDIPQWDFNWQQAYALSEFVEINPGDAVDLTCVYDNSAENQVVVDGVVQEPTDVAWGDGTQDEMCLLYMNVVSPFSPAVAASETECDPDASCDCGTSPTVDCLLACEEASFGCQACSFGAAATCTAADCGAALIEADACLRDCFVNTLLMAGSPGRCAAVECADEYAAVTQCMDPVLAAGTCAAPLADCGL